MNIYDTIQLAGPAIPMVLMAVGTVISAAGAVKQGRDQRKQMEAQARETQSNALDQVYDANYNQSVAEHNEKEALLMAATERSRIRRKGKAQAAGVTAQLQRQGLEIGAVSFDDVLSATAMESEQASADASYKAYQQGVGFRSQAAGFKRRGARAFTIGQVRAKQLRKAGARAETSGYFSAAGTLASGLGQAASMGGGLGGGAAPSGASQAASFGSGASTPAVTAGIPRICWVAQEVYSTDKWKDFRVWLMSQSPEWLFQLYLNRGEQFAHWLKAHPFLKPFIRKLMDSAVGR